MAQSGPDRLARQLKPDLAAAATLKFHPLESLLEVMSRANACTPHLSWLSLLPRRL
ncbi:hypothetical protein SAMN04515666_10852 [Bosea lupini]|uniref:Uncharacterized protein n=1 Tax=Bosea lupini TaxID=1036779 RepID=A0A1H7W7M5_9HYPH|nr:hypothetical protein SAMN04515666_10852 [Bosea lupini]